MYYFVLICLVASTLALPTIPDDRSPSPIEIKQKGKGYNHYVEIVEGNGNSYAEVTDTYNWKEEPEIDENINDHDKDAKEVEDEEVENEEPEDENVENEEAGDEEVADEEVEDEWVEDEEGSDEKKDDKYSNFEKSVIIKWKVPTSFLLNSLIANMSPAVHTPYPYVYEPFRFPSQNVPYPDFVNYHK